MPRVSVIIPCFNLGQYLDEAVGSVLSQTFQDFEILIVDDGSTDVETQRIVANYSRPNTTLFRTPNQGLAAARNFLIARAGGDFLCALDADDKLHPRFLETTVRVLEQNPELTFVSTHLQMFGEEDRIWPDEARCDLAALLVDDTIITPALVKRLAVLSVGGYDEHMPHQGNEDWDLWISLVEAGHRGVILPEVLFFYRRRRGSMVEQCTTGQTHLDLIRYLIAKHHMSYRLLLRDVLLGKEGLISDLRRGNVELETELATYLVPAVERRRAELDQLRVRLDEARRLQADRDAAARVPALEQLIEHQAVDLRALQIERGIHKAEIAALRASASWKLTAPMRVAYDLALRFCRGTRK